MTAARTSARNDLLHRVLCALEAWGDMRRPHCGGLVLTLVAIAVVGVLASTPFARDRPSAQRNGSVGGQMHSTLRRQRGESSHDRLLSFVNRDRGIAPAESAKKRSATYRHL